MELKELPEKHDSRGKLTFMQYGDSLPFMVKRVFVLYDIQPGQSRGQHAHRELEQLILCSSGCFRVSTEDLDGRQTEFFMNSRHQSLYIPPLTWTTIDQFEHGTVCTVLASDVYREDDYIRDLGAFRQIGKSK